MINYNDEDRAFAQRIHKELWTKDELRNFGSYCNGDNIRAKFGLGTPENQKEMDVNLRNKLNYRKQQKRIAAAKMGTTYDELS